jgi:hypothetical protein
MANPIKKKLEAAVRKASEVRQSKLENKSAVAKNAGDYQKSTKLQNKATKTELRQFGRDIKNMKG